MGGKPDDSESATLAPAAVPADVPETKKKSTEKLSAEKAGLMTWRLKAEKMKASFGPGHPAVKAIDAKIAAMEQKLASEKKLGQAPQLIQGDRARKQLSLKNESPADLSQMSDKELRILVGQLLQRVKKLESEVQRLKNPKAKVELLRQTK